MNTATDNIAPATLSRARPLTFVLRVGQAFVAVDTRRRQVAAKLTLTGYVGKPFVWSLRDQNKNIHKGRKDTLEILPGLFVQGRPGWRENAVELTVWRSRRYRVHYYNYARTNYPDMFTHAA